MVVKIDEQCVCLGLWYISHIFVRDTAGQEEFASLRPLAYLNCDVFLIVFSVLDKNSYENAYKQVCDFVNEVVLLTPKMLTLCL